ncbi:MAG: extracellular solute-binding protein, partial [Treponema sp.]|nr:extracellular solute-binding protein [Treponema sp.]
MKRVMNAVCVLAALSVGTGIFFGCRGKDVSLNGGEMQKVDPAELAFPLKKRTVITGLTSFPANTESNPNNRTIFKRLQEKTNVEVQWTAMQSDQWNDKITLAMANPKTLADFVFNASFNDSSLLKYAEQEIIIPLEGYIDTYMPNLKSVFDKYPEYRAMCTDSNGHIWGLPWIEQLGSGKEAIQVIDNMSFINKAWLDYLGLEIPTNIEEFEKVLVAFKENAARLQQEFKI